MTFKQKSRHSELEKFAARFLIRNLHFFTDAEKKANKNRTFRAKSQSFRIYFGICIFTNTETTQAP